MSSAAPLVRQPSLADVAALVFLGALWGTAFIGIKLSLESFGPFTVAFLRAALASVLLVAVCIVSKQRWPANGREWGFIAAMGFFSTAFPFSLISTGTQTLDASEVAIILGSGPFLGILLPALFGQREPLTAIKVLAVCLGFTGLLFIVGTSALAGLGDNLAAQFMVVTASASYVISGLLVHRVTGLSTLMLATAQTIAAMLFTLPLVLVFEGLPQAVTSNSVWAMIYLAALPTAFALIVRLWIIRRSGVGFMSQVGYLVPLFGVFWGALLLNERIEVTDWIACGLIVSGILLLRIDLRGLFAR